MDKRVIGNYIMGKKIGYGSFAVVWKSRHRQTGMEVAVKEIDKTQLLKTSPKIADNLLKEISILSNIRHPNIIRLFEAIQTEDKIFLVLEYCDGGDLAGYLHRHGKVSEAVARHFMRQLAAGLQVLNENCLIHRDLKPQNLLLTTNEGTPSLKIGDFGFARYVTPQGLADTLCGSPLYMAPEIIQNKKYDSKADLWSAGAILYQLVTGQPPFTGNSQLELFQNILRSGELRFPKGSLEEVHVDCVDLCRSLLRQNPVERLTFQEFFNHKFLQEPKKFKSVYSSVHGEDDKIKCRKGYVSTNRSEGVEEGDMPKESLEGGTKIAVFDQLRVTESMDSIEKGYVIVNPRHYDASSSTETLSCSIEPSLLSRAPSHPPTMKSDHLNFSVEEMQIKKMCSSSSILSQKDLQCHEPQLPSSTLLTREQVQGMPILHPSTRLHLLHEYIYTISEIAHIKFNAGLFLEYLSVELVVLALWKEAIKVSTTWLSSSKQDGYGSVNEPTIPPVKEGADSVDFSSPRSVSMWAKQGFLVALNRAEKLSNHVIKTEGNTQMPKAIEIIFQTALEIGKSGGVDELIGNKRRAAKAYSKAKILLSFVIEEATMLPLTPQFVLMPADRNRIKEYISHFDARHSALGIDPQTQLSY